MPKKIVKPDSTLPFESTIETLDKLVKKLEDQEIPLEEALTAFETGIDLTRKAQTALSAAEQRVSALIENDGELTSINFPLGEEGG